jgi:hypothetical protein
LQVGESAGEEVVVVIVVVIVVVVVVKEEEEEEEVEGKDADDGTRERWKKGQGTRNKGKCGGETLAERESTRAREHDKHESMKT